MWTSQFSEFSLGGPGGVMEHGGHFAPADASATLARSPRAKAAEKHET